MVRFIICFTVLLSAGSGWTGDAPFYANKLDLLSYIDNEGELHPVNSKALWQVRREHILQNMQQVMGAFPTHPRGELDVRVINEVVFPTYTRQEISILVEPGDRLSAYLSIPHHIDGKTAAILALHQTYAGGNDEVMGRNGSNNLRYGHELAERGYVVIAPDYPRFGGYEIDVYAMGYESATMKGIWNHMRCVDLLQQLPQVDPERIGAIGHSLGGHNTLFVGAFDPRIKAMVSSCGFTYFPKYYEGDLTGWTHQGYMPAIATKYDKDSARMPFDFTEVLAALAPRAVFINAPLRDANFSHEGVQDCVTAALPVYALLGAAPALDVVFPDTEHAFPPAQRRQAYAMFDAVLRNSTRN